MKKYILVVVFALALLGSTQEVRAGHVHIMGYCNGSECPNTCPGIECDEPCPPTCPEYQPPRAAPPKKKELNFFEQILSYFRFI